MSDDSEPSIDLLKTVGPDARFSDDTLTKLRGQLNPNRILTDPRGNPYLEGWDVIAAANVYFGFDGWSTEVLSIGLATSMNVERGRDSRLQEVSIYMARVAVKAGGVTHTDVGTGVTGGESPEAHETAIKGAVTDGIKRAMRAFGSQFGNDLYDKGRSGAAEQTADSPPAEQRPSEPKPDLHNLGEFLTKCMKDLGLNATAVRKLHGVQDNDGFTMVKEPLGDWNDLFAATKAMHEKANA